MFVSPPPPSLPPSGAPFPRENNTVSSEEAMGSLSVGSPELGENELKQLEDDVTNLFHAEISSITQSEKEKITFDEDKAVAKQFSVIKYGYASKYATSQTKSIRKQR